jgi:hypothetical protein
VIGERLEGELLGDGRKIGRGAAIGDGRKVGRVAAR